MWAIAILMTGLLSGGVKWIQPLFAIKYLCHKRHHYYDLKKTLPTEPTSVQGVSYQRTHTYMSFPYSLQRLLLDNIVLALP